MTRHLLEAIATITGCIVGAGILGIPYVIAKAGFAVGIVHIVIIGMAILLVNLYLGEVVLRTKGVHQLSGYAEKYLGKKGKHIMLFTLIAGSFGSIIAYTIGEGQAIAAILGNNPVVNSIFFYIIIFAIVYMGLNAIMESELVFMIVKLLIFIFIVCAALLSGLLDFGNLATVNLSYLFLPYGAVLFAYLGAVAIPEAKEELKGNLKHYKKAILIGSILPIILYAVFAFIVVGITGAGTTEVATIGIGKSLGNFSLILINLFAILAMATSFLAVAFGLKETLQYDYKIKQSTAFFLTALPPALFFLLNMNSFIEVIIVTGALTGGLEGVLIILMCRNARKKCDRKPEYSIKHRAWLDYAIIGLYILGIAYIALSIVKII